jgi:hypothetical protein
MWRWVALGFVFIVLTAIATPFLVPITGFIPELSALASKRLGQPVAIADLRLEMLPTPRVTIHGLRVGAKNEIRIDRAHIVPDLMLLIAGHKVVREIRAEYVRVQETAPAMLRAIPKSKPDGDAVLIRRIVLRNVKFEHRAFKLPEFDANIELAADLSASFASFVTRDRSLRLSVEPEGAGKARFQLTASNWRFPLIAAPLLFESLEAQGRIDENRLSLPKVNGRLYGGSLGGKATLEWSRQWRVNGQADLTGIALVPVQRTLGKKDPRLSGSLGAKSTFSSAANAPDQLLDALVLDGPFEVADGAWHGVDLSKAAELPMGKIDSGGATRFSELTGKFGLRGRGIKIEDLCIRSPKLVAGGRIEVAPDQTLSGKLDLSVAKTAGFVGIPVALAGTTADPSVRLTKGALIGGLIGTLLLPGIGTSLGASAGNIIEGKSGCK